MSTTKKDSTPAADIAEVQAKRPAPKTQQILALLSRPEGATVPELMAATGWLPHTTRAALTGLRKKGHVITRGSRDGTTFYTATAA